MNNLKVPCTDCITLPICKGYLSIYIFLSLEFLAQRCQLIRDYLCLKPETFKHHKPWSLHRRSEALKFLYSHIENKDILHGWGML